jgi:cation:H+ antiporter
VVIILGFAILYLGSKWMIDGAARFSILLGIPPFVVGITIVAFGSSAPEAVLALTAVATSSSDMALGGIIGSNIANIGLVLGVSALFCPLIIKRGMLRRELGFMLLALILISIMAVLGGYGFVGGMILLLVMTLFLGQMLLTLIRGFPISEGVQKEEEAEKVFSGGKGRQIQLLLMGLAVLIIGAQVIIWGAVGIAESLGIDQVIIGLTTIALGTSLPELSISVTAARRGEAAFVISNILGSNIFNSLFILGMAAALSPIAVPEELLWLEFPVMLVLAGMLAAFILWRGRIKKVEGFAFLAVYAGYIALLAIRIGLL